MQHEQRDERHGQVRTAIEQESENGGVLFRTLCFWCERTYDVGGVVNELCHCDIGDTPAKQLVKPWDLFW